MSVQVKTEPFIRRLRDPAELLQLERRMTCVMVKRLLSPSLSQENDRN